MESKLSSFSCNERARAGGSGGHTSRIRARGRAASTNVCVSAVERERGRETETERGKEDKRKRGKEEKRKRRREGGREGG